MATPKFQKGNSGKPKGAIHKATNHFLKIKNLAANDYKTAYELLWENMKIGEGWAFQIFFKHLIPKNIYQQTVVIEQENGVDRLEAITKALPQFEELTHDEAMNEIRTLKGVEPEAKKEKEENMFEVMSNEQIKLIMSWYHEGKAAKAINAN
jgi:plasmid maintenance system killer protein